MAAFLSFFRAISAWMERRWFFPVKIASFHWFLILIVSGAVLFLCYGISDPFVGSYRSYSTIYSLIAKNYVRYGYLATRLGWVVNADQVAPDQFVFYTRHPPLFGILLSLFVRIFGEQEWSYRLLPIVFSAGNIIFIFLIARELWGRNTGMRAALLAVLAPVFCAYGAHIDHIGSVLLFFMFGAFFQYLLWIKSKRMVYFVGLCIWFCLGALTGWPAYFLAPALLAHNLLIRRSRLIWILPALAVVIFGLFLFHARLLTGHWLGGQIWEMLLYRLRVATVHPAWSEIGYMLPAVPGLHFTFGGFLHRLACMSFSLLSPVLILLGCVWLARLLADGIRQRCSPADLLLLAFFVGCGAYCLVFSNATFQHEYILLCLWGPLAVAAATGMAIIGGWLAGAPRLKAALYGTVILLLVVQSAWVVNAQRRRAAASLWEYNFGTTIHARVPSGQAVLTSAPVSFAARYYADRFIRFDVQTPDAFLALIKTPAMKYQFFVARTNDALAGELRRLLTAEYPVECENGLLFLNLD